MNGGGYDDTQVQAFLDCYRKKEETRLWARRLPDAINVRYVEDPEKIPQTRAPAGQYGGAFCPVIWTIPIPANGGK